MQLQIRGKDLQISASIRETAERRAGRLDRLVDRVNDAKLELRRDKHRGGNDEIVAQLTLQTGKTILRAEERNSDAERAIDLVMEKMERRARKHHERWADRRTARVAADLPAASDDGETDDELDGAIVRTKRFAVKPMDPDEAAEQMALLGHDFFLFQNSDTSSVALLYKRRDGQLGLLIPENA